MTNHHVLRSDKLSRATLTVTETDRIAARQLGRRRLDALGVVQCLSLGLHELDNHVEPFW